MKKIYKLLIITVAISWSTPSFAGVLTNEWTEGTSRFCKYSDGEVIKISYGSTCSRTN